MAIGGFGGIGIIELFGIGDFGGTAIASGDDTIINYGIVYGDIIADAAYSFDGLIVAGVDPVLMSPVGNGTTSGNDTVINYGVVEGGIYTGGGNDRVVIVNGAPVFGLMDGGPDTDKLTFEFSSANYLHLAELEALANRIVAQNPQDGHFTIGGVLFTWKNFEDLLKHMKLAPFCNAWPVQVFNPGADSIFVWAPVNADEAFVVAEIIPSQLSNGPEGTRFQAPGSMWYVVVYWVGDHYQINVYDHTGLLMTDRCSF